jgi:nucleotide-binding universal stress UspA family protein
MLDDVDTTDLQLTTHIAHGSPSVLIPEVAHDVDAELIVVGTVGRTGIAGLLIGNTAESIFAQVECPVLAIKPEGFQTPVAVEAA